MPVGRGGTAWLGPNVAIDARQTTERPICVMTRVRLRGPWALVRFAWHYRRVRRTLEGVPDIMHVGLLAEGPFTWHMISTWRSAALMQRWAEIPEHVDAVRQTYGHGMTRESWSGRWRLEAVSLSARRWSKAPAMESIVPLQATSTPRSKRRHV